MRRVIQHLVHKPVPALPATELTFTTELPAAMWGTHARVTWNGPTVLMAYSDWKSSAESPSRSSWAQNLVAPALLTSASIRPNAWRKVGEATLGACLVIHHTHTPGSGGG